MTTPGFKRKLSAIFMSDVVGYSRLMGEDEAATLKTLSTYQGVMDGLIKQHRGRVVDAPGDAVLAEFNSVVDAVQCAVAVQKELQARNAELPENRRMLFRIGINLGDVIEEGDKIYGDGVNIAARLEALADPGGICISKTAFDHIETKLPLGYEFLGEKTVKNIAKPVKAYRVLLEPRVTVAGELTRKKSQLGWPIKAVVAAGLIMFVAGISLVVWQSGWLAPRPEKQAVPSGPQSPSTPPLKATPAPQTPAPSKAAAPRRLPPASKAASPSKAAPSPKPPTPVAKASQTPVSPPPPAASPTPAARAATKAPLTKSVPPAPTPLSKEASLKPVTPTAPPSPGVAPPTRVVPPRLRKGIDKVFRKQDTNNDGRISLNEFLIFRGAQFNRLDGDNDGSLTWFEVSAGRTRFDRKLLENFDLIDSNHDQKLSREEFLKAARRKFLHLDENRDGTLSENELLKARGSQLGHR
jgi:class 3 adenylate cyclase/Ca2+-binding EF-hand superfamily protein